MPDISPTVAKLVAATIAVIALVATAFVQDQSVQLALTGIASGLTGWQFMRRSGDVPVEGIHVDDMR